VTIALPQNDLVRENSLAMAMVDAVREPVVLLDRAFRLVFASRSFYQVFAVDPAEAAGMPFDRLSGGEWNIPALRRLLEDALARRENVDGYELEHDFAAFGRRTMSLNVRHVADARNPDAVLLLAIDDITERRETERLRDALLRQKETLLQEIQHRVANSLQIIASILMLKMRAVASEETRLHLRDAHRRVLAVATVQQQLRESVLGDRIEVGPYLQRLCEGLAKSMIAEDRRLSVVSSATGGTALSSDAVSFGLIVTELVINALKHGFPDGREGRIAVGFAADGAAWRLSVADDGVGRNIAAGKPAHAGLGTGIVRALARQLRARIESSDAPPGFMVSIVRAASGAAAEEFPTRKESANGPA
jgi:chemotaxis protein methyltransferase CheR